MQVPQLGSTLTQAAVQERSLVLQTQQRAHTSAWTLLHPASGSTEPVLSLELGRSITVYQGSGASKKPLTQLKKLKMFSSKRAFQHGGQTYCWRREGLKQRHEEFRYALCDLCYPSHVQVLKWLLRAGWCSRWKMQPLAPSCPGTSAEWWLKSGALLHLWCLCSSAPVLHVLTECGVQESEP